MGGAIKDAAARGVAVRMIYDVGHAEPDPRAAAAGAGRRADLVARSAAPADRGHPRPDAPQVRGARRRVRLDRVGELDGRFVDAPGERDPDRGIDEARRGLHGGLRAALGEGIVEDSGFVEPNPVGSRGTTCAPGSRRASARRCRGESRSGSGGPARVRICSPVMTRARCSRALRADLGGARHRGLSRPPADRRRHLPVGHRRERGLEAAAAEAGAQGRLLAKPSTPWGAGTVHDFMHAKVTSSTTSSSRAASTCRARASRTRRTCSRSKTRSWPTAWPPSSTRSAPATPRCTRNRTA